MSYIIGGICGAIIYHAFHSIMHTWFLSTDPNYKRIHEDVEKRIRESANSGAE